MRKRSPRPRRASDLLVAWIRRHKLEGRLHEAEIRDRWPEMVGPRVSARSEPVRLRDGLLTVRVASSPWLTELNFMRARMVPRINDVLGSRVVDAIRLVAGPVKARRVHPAPQAVDPPPATDQQRLQDAEIATKARTLADEAQVADAKLRRAVEAASRSLLRSLDEPG